MTTYLAQNQFISNSGTPPSTAVPDTAAADQVAPQVAAAEPFQSSCGNGESRTVPIGPQASAPRRSKELIGEAGVAPSPHEAIPSNEGRPSEAPAPRCTEPHEGAGALGCLTADDEALYWQLRRADNPFTRDLAEIPDAHALFDAIEPPPLFLQRQA